MTAPTEWPGRNVGAMTPSSPVLAAGETKRNRRAILDAEVALIDRLFGGEFAALLERK